MTTIACNSKEMAADTQYSWEGMGIDRVKVMKLYAINGKLYGTQGENCVGQMSGLEWLREGAIPANRPVAPLGADWHLLELSKSGVAILNQHLEREELMEDVLAVGSGRKVALYCMRALGMSPAQAVWEACKYDNYSSPPIYTASLIDPTIRIWKPRKKKDKAGMV